MAKKNLSDMSSEELYELARQREEQETAEEREAARAKVEELRDQRREMLARHRKEIAALEAEIRASRWLASAQRRRALRPLVNAARGWSMWSST